MLTTDDGPIKYNNQLGNYNDDDNADNGDDSKGMVQAWVAQKLVNLCHRPWYWWESIPAKMARLAKSQSLE